MKKITNNQRTQLKVMIATNDKDKAEKFAKNIGMSDVQFANFVSKTEASIQRMRGEVQC